MAKSTRVALENDYEIVLEGLRALLRSYAPDIRVIEFDIQTGPRKRVDVTLLDTYGEEDLDQRIRDLASDAQAGVVVVFSFSDQQRLVRRALKAGATGFISKALGGTQIVDGIRAAARANALSFTESPNAPPSTRIYAGPGSTSASPNEKANSWRCSQRA